MSALELLREAESLEKIKVEIPKGDISEEGQAAIQHKIYYQYDKFLPDNWEWTWVVTKGDYAGTFPKRVGSWLKKEFGIKADSQFLSEIGNIARAHSETRSQYVIDFTSYFDWDAGDFGDSGSCFWSCNEDAKDMMKSVNGFAIRFYESSETIKIKGHKGSCECEDCEAKVQETIKNGNPELDDDLLGFGRCWIIPDFPNSGDMTIFNSYPTNFRLIRVARIIATYFGMSYAKLNRLYNLGSDDGTLWINNGTGYVITNPRKVEKYQHENFDFKIPDPSKVMCDRCEEYFDEDDLYSVGDEQWCSDCHSDYTFRCERCDEVYSDSYNPQEVYTRSYWGGITQQIWCEYCVDNHTFVCEYCNDLTDEKILMECPECGDEMCISCIDRHYHEELEEENV